MFGDECWRSRARWLARAAAVVLLGCGVEPGPPAVVEARNLVLVSLDTLRADRLGAYGYDRPTSPVIDRLAARGVRFETVIAESSWTLPSHVTLFTGLPPIRHGVNTPFRRLAEHVPTAPEILQARGFRTIAATGGGFLAPRYGFARGFDHFEEDLAFAGALEAAAREIEATQSRERFFAFVHTYEVHCPYDPPEPYATEFQRQPAADRIETRERCGNSHFNDMALRDGQVAFLSDRYDAEIGYADHLLGRFLERLDAAGRLADTLVVVVSDHGEEFREHGLIGHVKSLYIESLRVPWIIAGPGVAAGVVERPVGLADVLPTLLALLGIDDAAGPAPLAALIRGEGRGEASASSDPPARFSHNDWQEPLASVVVGEHHAIYRKRSKQFQVFDWREDPREQTDLAGLDPGRDRALQEILFPFLVARPPPGPSTHEKLPSPDADQIEKLRALGYVE